MPTLEYSPGSLLHLKIVPDDLPIEVTITHAYTPFTMSPVLRVSLAPGLGTASLGVDTPMEMVLKLYDRRYFSNAREQCGFKRRARSIKYTSRQQDAYAEYVLALENGEKEPIDFDALCDKKKKTLSVGEFEGFVAHLANKYYQAELRTYEQLQALQGKRIPRLYSPILYEHAHGIPDPVLGLLLEYVPSLSLIEFFEQNPLYPLTIARKVCDDAVKLVREIDDQEIINEDVRLGNTLVRLSSLQNMDSENTLPACMFIDFTHCRKRRPDESDEEWRDEKWLLDEEGVFGHHVQSKIFERYFKLKEVDSREQWRYRPSYRYYTAEMLKELVRVGGLAPEYLETKASDDK